MKKIPAVLVLFFVSIQFSGFSQIGRTPEVFTHDDTLRGSITPERVWWDLLHYQLNVTVNPSKKYISGNTSITYQVLQSNQKLQIDLQPPLTIKHITQDNANLDFQKIGTNAYHVALKKKQEIGNEEKITVYYEGNPKEAKRAPWDGGFSWKKDSNGNDFVATSCQGLGASVWWPCKDHMYDEPDNGMDISITAPENLMGVSNGRLRTMSINPDGTRTYYWTVANPINNYGVNLNVGNYVHFSETYEGEKGKLDMDYYVLSENLEKAKEHFKDARRMMEAFEHWFGPYPFYEDGFKLVEVPYLGMEHQSSVTYGNQYKKGYLGTDLSGTGHGLTWDFIIIHEAGHEWFANNITYKDIADMWIHESFTNYSENLFTEYFYGKKAGAEYVIGTRKNIKNDRPIIGTYNVNNEGSGDMYYKGANMLHTIRQLVNDDEKWRQILRGLNEDFYHQTVTTQQIEDYLSSKTQLDLSKVFDQYLRDTRIPTLEWKLEKNQLCYRWNNVVNGFAMPVKVTFDGTENQLIMPTTEWKKAKATTLEIDENFYVSTKKINE